MADNQLSAFSIPNDVPICQLDCTSAFNGLEEKEKKYAYYLAKACNEGGLICLLQTSPESPAIFSMFQKLYGKTGTGVLRSELRQAQEDITDDDLDVSKQGRLSIF